MKPPVLAHSCLHPREFPPEGLAELAMLGRSNSGKSTLLNALVGARVAHVSQDPGRTRRIHFYDMDQRWYLVDLPGYGFAKVPTRVRAEFGQAVDFYLSTRQSLVGAILIQDVRRGLEQEEEMLVEWSRARNIPLVVVANKADKLNQRERLKRQRALEAQYQGPVHLISAYRGTGLEPVRAQLAELGVAPGQRDPSRPSAESRPSTPLTPSP